MDFHQLPASFDNPATLKGPLTPSEKSVFISAVRKHYVLCFVWKPRIEEKLDIEQGFDNFIPKFADGLVNVNGTAKQLPCKFSQLVYVVKRSLSNVPARDNISSNFAEE